jgi:hypothetical protein
MDALCLACGCAQRWKPSHRRNDRGSLDLKRKFFYQ